MDGCASREGGEPLDGMVDQRVQSFGWPNHGASDPSPEGDSWSPPPSQRCGSAGRISLYTVESSCFAPRRAGPSSRYAYSGHGAASLPRGVEVDLPPLSRREVRRLPLDLRGSGRRVGLSAFVLRIWRTPMQRGRGGSRRSTAGGPAHNTNFYAEMAEIIELSPTGQTTRSRDRQTQEGSANTVHQWISGPVSWGSLRSLPGGSDERSHHRTSARSLADRRL